MKKFFFLFVLGFLTTATIAQTVNVTFRVNMRVQVQKGLFNIATDSVVVRGSFQMDAGEPANWAGGVRMTKGANDTIYSRTATFPVARVGTAYEFKFVSRGDNWEAGDNRTFTLASTPMTFPVAWFGRDSIFVARPVVANSIRFTADLTDMWGSGGNPFDPTRDSITVQGLDWDGLGTFVSGNRRVAVISPLQPRIYGTTIRVRGFLGDSTKWKFRAHPETRFTNTGWETGEDRWFRYVSDTVSTHALASIKPRIFPSTGPLSRPTPYTFQVDMANARNRYNNQLIPLAQLNFVGIKGGSLAIGNWGGNWVVSDTTVQPNGYPFITRMNDAGVSGDLVAGDRIWSRTIIFPDSAQTGGIEFKYAAHYPGADTVNGGSQPMDNEAGFGQNRIFILSEQPVGFTPRLRTFWGVMGLVGIKENKTITPDQFRLVQNYPNPFNPSTTITFSLPSDQNVSLKIYNIMGEVVATLIDGFHKAGSFDVEFNASNLASGIYFYTLQSDNFSSTKKMMLMK